MNDGIELSHESYGVLVVAVTANRYFPYVRQYLERDAKAGKKWSGIPMLDKRRVVSLRSTAADLALAHSLELASNRALDDDKMEFIGLGLSRDLDCFSQEGLSIVATHAADAKGAWLSICHSSNTPADQHMGFWLARLKALAVEYQLRLVLFLSMPSASASEALQELCDELAVVEECEPDPGDYGAVSIICPAYSALHPFGTGARMCKLNLKENEFRAHSEPFISARLSDRRLWALLSDGVSVNDVARQMGIDRTTVWRRRGAISAKVKFTKSEAWHTRVREMGDDGEADPETLNESRRPKE